RGAVLNGVTCGTTGSDSCGSSPGGGCDDGDGSARFVGAVGEPMRYGRVVGDRIACFEDEAFSVEIDVLLAGDHDHELLSAVLERSALGRRAGWRDDPDRLEASREVGGEKLEDGVIARRFRCATLQVAARVLADDR